MRRDHEGLEAPAARPPLTRREVVGGALATGALAAVGAPGGAGARARTASRRAGRAASGPPHVAVIGAGAFGGWIALWLRRLGARVTLIDAWGPGNSRASSGGETRVIRGMYGAGELYTRWVVRAFELWRETARQTGLDLYHQTGALWMFRGDDAYARSSRPILEAAGLPLERLEAVEARRRFPQIDFQGVQSVWFEAEAGYLTARRACDAVARLLEAEGGEIRRAAAMPGLVRSGRMASVRLLGGAGLAADAFVFACGPWLGGLFPEVIGERIRPTRQEVFFFGPPVVDARFAEGRFPVWVDYGERIFYGIPGNENRGFKVADDTHGERVDPTTLERRPDEAALERARGLLRERFPALADAPLLESRVCQYENTRDGHFVIDRQPDAANAWLVGGGSGHGFKLGPAVGERVAAQVLGREEPLPELALERLDRLEGPERSQLETGEGP